MSDRKMSRRKMLALTGGGVVLAAGAGAAGFLTTRTPTTALAPWNQAGDYTEPRRRALSYALLAPNPHNLQPWKVDLGTPDTVVLHRDPDRALPHTDPHSRQLTIGMGCFLELMDIAASQTGHAVETELFPEGEDGPVARAVMRPGQAEADPLFGAVKHRRSCKEPFEDRPIAADAVQALSSLAKVVTDPSQVKSIVDLTWAAWLVEEATPRTLKESIDVMRIGKREIEANPDGIDLGGPFLGSLAAMGMLSREAMLDTNSSTAEAGRSMYDELLHATPAYAVLTTPGNSRSEQIEAGRRWLRLNLTTTALGLSLHPVSQALQEYPEMRAHYDRAHELLAPDGGTVQMLGRLGYGPTVSPSPRWPLDAKIVEA